MATATKTIQYIQNDPFYQESVLELYPELVQKITLKHWISTHRKQAKEISQDEYNTLMDKFEDQKEKIYARDIAHD